MNQDNFWEARRVLVTGGCGFIGSHLVEALLAAGASVRVLGRYSSTGSWGHLNGLDAEYGDRLEVRLGTVTDTRFVRECCEDVDTVFHLAALIGIPYSYVAPYHYVDVNMQGTLAVLEAVRDTGVRRLVHTSTSETFGSAQSVPMDEHHPLVAQSPYAASKIAADQLVGSYFRSFGTPAVTLRPFNTFGPRQSTRAVIPTIIQQLLRGPTVRIGSLTPVRDMNPVHNTVDAFLRAGEVEGIEGDVFVVGSGTGHTIADLIAVTASLLHRDPDIVVDDDRLRPEASEVDRLVCDYGKASRVLGYEPHMSLADGLAATIEYCRQHPVTRDGYAI